MKYEIDELGYCVIPNGTIVIKNYAFNDCHALKSVEIPDSVTTIENHAFEACSLSVFRSVEQPKTIRNIQA